MKSDETKYIKRFYQKTMVFIDYQTEKAKLENISKLNNIKKHNLYSSYGNNSLEYLPYESVSYVNSSLISSIRDFEIKFSEGLFIEFQILNYDKNEFEIANYSLLNDRLIKTGEITQTLKDLNKLGFRQIILAIADINYLSELGLLSLSRALKQCGYFKRYLESELERESLNIFAIECNYNKLSYDIGININTCLILDAWGIK